MELFAERLKEAMAFRNFRQVDLVNATSIDKGTISNYLSGKYKPKNVNAVLIARALNVNVLWLLGYEDVPMETDQYVDYSLSEKEEDSATVYKWEEGFEKSITKEVWTGYYEKIMSLPKPEMLEVLKMVTLMVAMADMRKKFNRK